MRKEYTRMRNSPPSVIPDTVLAKRLPELLIKCFVYGALLGAVLTSPLRAQKSSPELWYWHHSALKNAQAVQSSESLIDKAFSYGYTGVAFWDPTFEYISSAKPPDWDSSFPSYMQQVMNYAIKK